MSSWRGLVASGHNSAIILGAGADGGTRVGKSGCEEWDVPLVVLSKSAKGDKGLWIGILLSIIGLAEQGYKRLQRVWLWFVLVEPLVGWVVG